MNRISVALEKNVRTDDVEGLVNAIRHMRGVMAVEAQIVDYGTEMVTEMRVKNELWDKIHEVFYPRVSK